MVLTCACCTRAQELDELQSKKVAIKNLGDVFAKRESMFKLYAIFCSAIVDVNQRVEQFKDKKPPFAAFLEVRSPPPPNPSPSFSSFSFFIIIIIIVFFNSFWLIDLDLQKCFVNPECRLLPLDSFVHAPLARLLKYPLLLDVRPLLFIPYSSPPPNDQRTSHTELERRL